MALISLNNLERFFNNLKTYISNALSSKANTSHTHTSSDITDLPNGYVVDSTLDGTSSNAIANSAVKNALDGLTSAGLYPIGSYIQFAGSQAPAGFLVCNGGAISRTTYSKLFAVIGTKYGSGNGSTTFNLPNLTDRFLQGSTSVGTVKNAGLPNITGGASFHGSGTGTNLQSVSGSFEGVNARNRYDDPKLLYTSSSYDGFNFTASYSNSIYGNSSTVQPPALTCLICIKY